MKYYNFEYDGLSLNDLGYTICSFDSNDQETISKPVYNAGSKYKLTAAVNVWTKPTTTSTIKKVKDLTADGRKHATSKKLNANAVLKAGTVVDADAVSTDTAGNIWLKIPSGFIPVYYKGKKRANWYNK